MQPQTLMIGTLLLYLNAFFNILTPFVPVLLLGVAMAAGGYGIANERRWGYTLGLAGAVVNFLLVVAVNGSGVFDFPGVISLLFTGALVLLLLHPESRNYQRIYFR